jgi:hypothetical protein
MGDQVGRSLTSGATGFDRGPQRVPICSCGAASEALVHILGVDQTLTIEQAFQAMRCFVDQFMRHEPEQYRERFEQIIRWTRVEGDGITYDPAQWEDWKASVARALGPESNLP